MRDNIYAIYLAAGASSRMGFNKLLLELGDQTLGSNGLHAILQSTIKKTFVISRVGDDLSWMNPIYYTEKFYYQWKPIYSMHSTEGQSQSLICGLHEASRYSPEAYIVLLADQPFVSTHMIEVLIQEYRNSVSMNEEFDYIAASDRGIVKPPIIFNHTSLPKLLELRGDIGARALIHSGVLKGKLVEFNDPRLFIDIDTIQDYEKIVNNHEPIEKI